VKQADSPNTTGVPADQGGHLSRRRVLGRLASSAAAGAVLTTPLPAVSASVDDAELLALKPQFDKLFDEWVRISIEEYAEHHERVAAIERETGIKERPAINWQDPAWIAWKGASGRLIEGREYADENRRLEEFLAALASSVDEILAYIPTTLDGLRLQARAIMAIDDDLVWSKRTFDEEPDYPRLASFFEGLCAFLDIPFPPVDGKGDRT
jgi:hypothetical protein